jgi:DNA-binding transcriptional regulator YhcF (GntR family)
MIRKSTTMAALSIDSLFDAAIRIQIMEQSITLTFTENAIRIKFPTTRRLAEFLDVPHYYILPYFAMMEEEELITRAERVGVLTTAKGSRKMLALIQENYAGDMQEIIGKKIFSDLSGKR